MSCGLGIGTDPLIYTQYKYIYIYTCKHISAFVSVSLFYVYPLVHIYMNTPYIVHVEYYTGPAISNGAKKSAGERTVRREFIAEAMKKVGCMHTIGQTGARMFNAS